MINQKIYIGQSNKETERWRQHQYLARQENPIQYIHRAIKKHGINNFTISVARKLRSFSSEMKCVI
jgi:hypothetical protein